MNRVTVQREQARTDAIRRAEWAEQLVEAIDWLDHSLHRLDVNGEARAVIVAACGGELAKMRARAVENAEANRHHATAIQTALTAATRRDVWEVVP